MDYAKQAALHDLARKFVSKISQGFDAANAAMGISAKQKQAAMLLPDGPLSFIITLGLQELELEGVVNALIEKRKTYISLRDYFSVLQFAITVDAMAGSAQGWFIRENKPFDLNVGNRTVSVDGKTFILNDVRIVDDDIMASPEEIATWFGFKTDIVLSNLQIRIVAPQKLPVEERLVRGNRKNINNPNGPPQFPLMVEGQEKAIGYPIVGVSSTYSYDKDGETGEETVGYNSSVLANGDFLKGRLTSEAQMNKKDNLSALRARYTRETLEPELLGPLKARRYELGDVTSVRMPIATRTKQGLGARVSNIDPARVFTNSATGISGNAPPGWDVELYRNTQFIESQTTGVDGFYRFENVDLFRSNNNFRVVMYGPQGEIREQAVIIPVDPYRLSESGSAYDMALTVDDTQIYRKQDLGRQQQPRLTAIYETPIGGDTAVSAGLTSGVRTDMADVSSERVHTVHGGLSTALGSVLANAGVALENTGEAGAQLVTRADYGTNQFRNELDVQTEKFGDNVGINAGRTLSNQFQITGPLAWAPGRNPRYNAELNYAYGQDAQITDTLLGYSATFGRINLNQQVHFTTASNAEDARWYGESSLRGSLKGFYIRGDMDYQIKPENKVE
jgi:hypothetical protein